MNTSSQKTGKLRNQTSITTMTTNTTGSLFQEEEMPFNLTWETIQGPTTAELLEAERQRRTQEQAERNQQPLF